jgi:outer membrane protein assembly factor BamB
MKTASNPIPANAAAPDRIRHIWFPLVVVGLVVAWWLRREAATGYTTLVHVLVILMSAAVLSVWFVSYGGGRKRVRQWIVRVGWLAFIAWMVVMKPVYNGDMGIYAWKWRFGRSADELLAIASGGGEASDWQATPHDYPRFLGNGYWAEVPGVELDADWQAHPPEEIWRHAIGAGWSGMAIVGNYVVTQEQRGDEELVSCYRVDTGELVWAHSDETRFDPADFQGSIGGIGPRGTPTIHDGRIFTQGGTGIVNCLDARTGDVIWSHDTHAETGADPLVWGQAGSPLVVDDLVVVNVGAPNDEAARENYHSSLGAYDLETGEVRWTAGNRQASYASPLVATLAGERQIVMVNEKYITAHRVDDGAVLWEYPWANESDSNATTTQPIPLAGDRLFMSKGYGVGSSLLKVSQNAEGKFVVEPIWDPPIKRVMKTKFANAVVRDEYVYGLDEVLLSCVDIATGDVKWKKRRSPAFGHGQIMLVGDKIVVLSETGEVALVEATPEKYREVAQIQALDSGDTTWNTPAFAAPFLLVRNAHEIACYRLPLAGDNTQTDRQ